MAGYIGYKRTIQLDFNYDAVKQGVPKVNQQMALLNAEFNKTSAQVKATGTAMDKLSIENQKLANQIQLQKDKVSSLQKELEKLTTAETKNQRAIASKQIELKNAQAKLIGMQQAYAASNIEMEKATTLSGKLKLATEDVRVGFERAGVNVDDLKNKFLALGLATTTFVTTTTGAFMNFESSMIKSRTIMDETTISYEQMQQNVLDMSSKYAIDAKTMAEANYQILSSAVETADANKILEQSAILAKTGFTDVATAADILTSIMNGYGVSVEDASLLVDQLIKTQDVGKLEIGELSASMGDLIGIASSVNVPIIEVEAAIAAMTQSGIKADTAITNMKQILSTIANPAAGAIEAADKYKISLDAASISSEGFATWLEKCLRKTKGNSAALGEMFGNVKSWSGMVNLAKENGEAFTQCLNEITNSAGTANQSLETISNTTGARWGKSTNDLKIAFIELGDSMTPIVDLASEVVSAIARLPQGVILASVGVGTFCITLKLLQKLLTGISGVATLAGFSISGVGAGAGVATAGMSGAATSGGILSKVLSALGVGGGIASTGLGATGTVAGTAAASLGATAASTGTAAAGLTTVGTAGGLAGAGLTATGMGASIAVGPLMIIIAVLAALAVVIALVIKGSKSASKDLSEVGKAANKTASDVEKAAQSTESAGKKMSSTMRKVSSGSQYANGVKISGYASGTNYVKEDGYYTVNEGNETETFLRRGQSVRNASQTARNTENTDMSKTNSLLEKLVDEMYEVKETIARLPEESLRVART